MIHFSHSLNIPCNTFCLVNQEANYNTAIDIRAISAAVFQLSIYICTHPEAGVVKGKMIVVQDQPDEIYLSLVQIQQDTVDFY